eukprot:gene15238-16812_t
MSNNSKLDVYITPVQVSIFTSKVLKTRESKVRHVDYKIAIEKEDMERFLSSYAKSDKGNAGLMSAVPQMLKLLLKLCESMMNSSTLVEELKSADIIITLPLVPCLIYMTDYVNKPFILLYPDAFSLTGFTSGTPLPPSYVPLISASEEMTFLQRTMNFLLVSARNQFTNIAMNYLFGSFTTKYNISQGKTLLDVTAQAEMHLVSSHFAIEFAHPLLPNVFYVGPILPKPANQLPAEFEQIMQESGDNGVVLIAFGSHISSLNDKIIAKMAKALSKLRQTVIWKIKLPKDVKVSPNVKIFNWLPQNDILGHAQLKVFVSHMGANSANEAAYHGVPLVAACIMSDSFSNTQRYVHKAKMAKFIDIFEATSSDWVNTIEEVVYNSSYKENALRTSYLIRSGRRTAVQKSADLIECTLVNGGRLPHLKSHAHNLTWYQYHCVDVIAFLAQTTMATWSKAALLLACITLALLSSTHGSVQSKKVVFFPMPMGNSPYYIFLTMAEEMLERGHENYNQKPVAFALPYLSHL